MQSVGIASIGPDQPLPLDELLVKADQAIYQAKHGGRNGQATWQVIKLPFINFHYN